jgi:ABC-type multidrug transport system fused ATPase/permease subunit
MIKTAFKDSTVLTIAHRLSTLQNSDKVMVLSEGRVVEWGDTKYLLNKQDGVYRKMCE